MLATDDDETHHGYYPSINNRPDRRVFDFGNRAGDLSSGSSASRAGPDESAGCGDHGDQAVDACEQVRAAKILAGLDRPDLAKGFLAKVLAANLDQAALFDLEQQFGAPLFINLSIRPELAPEGQQLADAVLQAAQACSGIRAT